MASGKRSRSSSRKGGKGGDEGGRAAAAAVVVVVEAAATTTTNNHTKNKENDTTPDHLRTDDVETFISNHDDEVLQNNDHAITKKNDTRFHNDMIASSTQMDVDNESIGGNYTDDINDRSEDGNNDNDDDDDEKTKSTKEESPCTSSDDLERNEKSTTTATIEQTSTSTQQDTGGGQEIQELEINKGNNDGNDDEENSNDDDGEEEQEEEEQEDEQWDLKHVHSPEEIRNEKHKCMTKKCPLIACTTYVSSLDPNDTWYSCLDCQEKDFGGWPTELNEIPISFITEEHRDVILEKCTGRYSPEMPNLPLFDPSSSKATAALQNTTDEVIKEIDNEKSCNAATTSTSDIASNSMKSKATAVTPPPGQNRRASITAAMNETNSTKQSSTSKGNKVTPIPMKKPSNQALAVHKKWQDAAKALGGERIVVSKPAAKKLILDLLKDSFKPMNITDIFKRLKGVVPSPVLKSSLDDMALDRFNPQNQFTDSDDDDEDDIIHGTKKATMQIDSNDEYAGSLCIKPGRNTNTTLYYCDYSKLSNNGNGLLPDDHNTLLSDHEVVKAEKEAKENAIKSMTVETAKLNSEPTNEKATASLEQIENSVQTLREELDLAQELKGFEKVRLKVTKKVDVMAAQWRRRKRLCMDFLLAMEDNTDGTISVKKCLSGDGQIYIESDGSAIRGQKEYALNQRRRGVLGRRPNKKQKVGKSSISTVPADESFIAVDLDARGSVQRIHLDDDM